MASAPAAAQDVNHRISLGAAAGVSTPFYGDFDFTAGSWQADVRFDVARHFGFSLFLEEWRHTGNQVFTNSAISGPAGPLGRVERITTKTAYRTRTVGWNALSRGSWSRLTFTGGGGVGYLLYSRTFREAMRGCQPVTLCNDFTQEFDNSSFAAQAQAGVDVAVAAHLTLSSQFRIVIPVEDPGAGHDSFLVGVRFGF